MHLLTDSNVHSMAHWPMLKTQQEFFYHVLLTLDSHVFNTHLKRALMAEIGRLYHMLSRRERRRTDAECGEGPRVGNDDGYPRNGDGVGGFTDIMVKLKVSRSIFLRSSLLSNVSVSQDRTDWHIFAIAAKLCFCAVYRY